MCFGIRYYNSDELTRQVSIASSKEIELFSQLREFFDDEEISQTIRADVMTIKKFDTKWKFDRITKQFSKVQASSFSKKIWKNSNQIEIPLSTFNGINLESERSGMFGQIYNLVLQHHDNINKTVIVSGVSDSLFSNFFYNRLLAWFESNE